MRVRREKGGKRQVDRNYGREEPCEMGAPRMGGGESRFPRETTGEKGGQKLVEARGIRATRIRGPVEVSEDDDRDEARTRREGEGRCGMEEYERREMKRQRDE